MTRARWIIFAAICIGILGFVLVNKKPEVTFKGDATKVISEGPIADHVFGSNEQKVTLIEYGDYQCPACEAMFPSVQQLTNQYKDHLTFIFRNFPLTNIHPNALAAATVAEAAGLQGKYYEMHDLLYQTQPTWESYDVKNRTNYFEGLAKQLNLNLTQFKSDVDSSTAIDQKIARDHATSQVFSTTGTPTFILNGQKLSDAVGSNGDKLKKTVEDALKQAGFNVNSSQPAASAQTPAGQ